MDERPKQDRTEVRGFRALLLLGAAVSMLLGLAAIASPETFESVLGITLGKQKAGSGALFGGLLLATGVGYALASVQPARSRALLVQLFAVPAAFAVTSIVGLARDGISAGQGIVFTLYNAAYCLLYFRMYPRVGTTAQPPDGTSRIT